MRPLCKIQLDNTCVFVYDLLVTSNIMLKIGGYYEKKVKNVWSYVANRKYCTWL